MKTSNIILLAGIGVLGFAVYKAKASGLTPIQNTTQINPLTNQPSAGDYSLTKTNPNYQPQYNPVDALHSALYGGY